MKPNMFLVSSGLLLLHLITVFCQDPTLELSESAPKMVDGVIRAPQAKDVRLSCLALNVPRGSTVRWQKRLVDHKTGMLGIDTKISEDQGVEDNNKYSMEKPTDNTWLLRIKSMGIDDEGLYYCFIQLSSITRKSASVYVKAVANVALVPEKTSSDTTAKEGDNVELQCFATGIPPPRVVWTRLGNKNLPIGREKHVGPVLQITNIKPEDRGTYRCTIENEVSDFSRDVHVFVKFSPIVYVQNTQVQNTVVKQAVGYQIELQCFVTANPYPADAQMGWFREKGARVVENDRVKVKATQGSFSQLNYELIIGSVQPSDYGTYTCRLTNSEGTRTGVVRLEKTDTPQASFKLGRVISGVSGLLVSISTLLSCLFVGLLHYH